MHFVSGLETTAVPDQDIAAARLTRSYAQLFSLAVHEFRTPISVVGGYLRMLQRDAQSPLADRHKKMVEEAEKSCARLTALIGEMNEVAKLDDATVPMQQESLDLFSMIRDVAGETHEAEDRGVRLQFRGVASGAALQGDAVRLHNAFSALCRAVLREQPEQAVVIVDCRVIRENRSSSALVVIANDDQLSSALAAAPSVFDEKRGGLGLALPIARRVIERHGGRIWSPPSEKGEFGVRGAVLVSIPLA